ncbi:single-stranded-DNA-specific exonuclease RecJ [Patescibacteria group bacterium]|jgi:single-stranded-DNA-specific exonuclease|nr:single-stranded-DNA-specific exonuclease RecJ [Patescibacteria group bacterium]
MAHSHAVTGDTTPQHALLTELLAARGIAGEEAVARFLAPQWERDTHDPALLPDLERAATLIEEALAAGERLGLFCDYDADGIPGGVLFRDTLRTLGAQDVEVYIPHRNNEGFGLSTDAVDSLAERGVSLLITIDCGSANAAEVAHAHARGMRVVVTDHHHVPEQEPSADAFVNPNRPGSRYPNTALCGAGVAFKLAHALLSRAQVTPGREKWLLDLVAIATISDLVSLAEPENRALAYYGLIVLRKSRRPGLIHLCRKLGLSQRYLTEDDIGFSIAPRINAASRMDSPELAFDLLATTDEREAGELARTLDRLNNERKGVVAAMVRTVRGKLAGRASLNPVIVAGDPSWQPSLVGLVAGSLMEEYQRPVFIWGRDGAGTLKGSVRAPAGSNIIALMEGLAQESLLEFGGHACAGGFSISHERIHTLEEELSQALAAQGGGPEVLEPTPELALVPDATLRDVHALLERLAPFGVDNPKPLVRVADLRQVSVRRFGKGNEHLELTITHRDGGALKAIKFFARDNPDPSAITEVVGHLELSRFAGKVELRLRLVAL